MQRSAGQLVTKATVSSQQTCRGCRQCRAQADSWPTGQLSLLYSTGATAMSDCLSNAVLSGAFVCICGAYCCAVVLLLLGSPPSATT
jgi:hypothetical protein